MNILAHSRLFRACRVACLTLALVLPSLAASTPALAADMPSPIATVYSKASVYVREAPTTESSPVTGLQPGQAVYAGPEADGWRPIWMERPEPGQGPRGYVWAPLLLDAPPEGTAPRQQEAASAPKKAEEPAPAWHSTPPVLQGDDTATPAAPRMNDQQSTASPDAEQINAPLHTVDQVANLRSSLSQTAPVVGQLHPGDQIRALAVRGDWVAVFEANQRKGDPPVGFALASALGMGDSSAADEGKDAGSPDDRPQDAASPEGMAASSQMRAPVSTAPPVRASHPSEVPAAEPTATPSATPADEPAVAPADEGPWQPKYVHIPIDLKAVRSSEAQTTDHLLPGQRVYVGRRLAGWYAVRLTLPPEGGAAPAHGYAYAPLLDFESGIPALEMPREPVQDAADRQTQSPPLRGTLMTTDSTVNIRAGRGTDHPITGSIEPGQQVRAERLRAGWYAVYDAGTLDTREADALGYVLADLLRPVDPDTQAEQKTDPGLPPDFTVLQRESTGDRMTMAILCNASVLPRDSALLVLAERLWFRERGSAREMHIYMYLPGMDAGAPAYAVARFFENGESDFRTRSSALYGSPWAGGTP